MKINRYFMWLNRITEYVYLCKYLIDADIKQRSQNNYIKNKLGRFRYTLCKEELYIS